MKEFWFLLYQFYKVLGFIRIRITLDFILVALKSIQFEGILFFYSSISKSSTRLEKYPILYPFVNEVLVFIGTIPR